MPPEATPEATPPDTTPPATRVPRIRGNDHGVLAPPPLGAWTPRLSVSVIIPAHRSQRTLDLALAALAAQSYPAHLLEVIVADDGSDPPLRLPEIAPERTRLVRCDPGGWGAAWACQTAMRHASGDVVHRLDSDVVPHREHVEALMRWHHLADYLVVTGALRFTEEDLPSPAEVYAAVAGDRAAKLFDWSASHPHAWIEDQLAKTRDLRDAPVEAFKAHVGASASMPARLYREAGGMDPGLPLGEDTEFGYRLAQRGAVFLRDADARAWHVGAHTMRHRGDQAKRHNWPLLAERVPALRWLRRHPRRQWLVPCVEAVVEAGGEPYERVRATVDALLASTLPDLSVTVVGPWSELPEGRRSPLDDPWLDLRLVQYTYEHEPRVRLAETIPPDAFPAMFRLTCPPGWAPSPETVRRLVKDANANAWGLTCLALDETPDAVIAARLERTAAVTRARHLRADGEDLDDVIDEVFGVHWLDGASYGFTRQDPAPG